LSVNGDMALATFDFLARIVSALPPLSAVLTDGESMMATVGWRDRPRWRRASSRRAVTTCGHTPNRRQRRKSSWQGILAGPTSRMPLSPWLMQKRLQLRPWLGTQITGGHGCPQSAIRNKAIQTKFLVLGRVLRCCVPPLTGGRTFFLFRQKESSQRRRRPRVVAPLRGVPCATRTGGRLAMKRRQPKSPASPALLSDSQGRWNTKCSDTDSGFNLGRRSATPLAPCGAPSNAAGPGAVGWRLFIASRPARRVAQGSRRSRPRNLGWPSFWLLFLGHSRKSTPADQRRNQRLRKSNIRATGAEHCPRKPAQWRGDLRPTSPAT